MTVQALNSGEHFVVLFPLVLAQQLKKLMKTLQFRFRRGDAVLTVPHAELALTIADLETIQRHWKGVNIRRDAEALQKRIDALKAKTPEVK